MRLAIGLLAWVWIAGCFTARAGNDVWTALVLATEEKPAGAVPAALKPYAKGLDSIFGYNTFYLMGEGAKQIRKGDEEWIVPTREVFMKLRCLDRNDGVYRLQIELYVKKKVVASSEVRLARGAPLYVRGPGWGRGRLVFILEVR